MSSVTDISTILQNWTPGYVPPVSWEKLGREAFYQGLEPVASWPDTMRRAWIRMRNNALTAIADAETSVYLARGGVQ